MSVLPSLFTIIANIVILLFLMFTADLYQQLILKHFSGKHFYILVLLNLFLLYFVNSFFKRFEKNYLTFVRLQKLIFWVFFFSVRQG